MSGLPSSSHRGQPKWDRDHVRPRTSPGPTSDEMEARLAEVVGPATYAVAEQYRRYGVRWRGAAAAGGGGPRAAARGRRDRDGPLRWQVRRRARPREPPPGPDLGRRRADRERQALATGPARPAGRPIRRRGGGASRAARRVDAGPAGVRRRLLR